MIDVWDVNFSSLVNKNCNICAIFMILDQEFKCEMGLSLYSFVVSQILSLIFYIIVYFKGNNYNNGTNDW